MYVLRSEVVEERTDVLCLVSPKGREDSVGVSDIYVYLTSTVVTYIQYFSVRLR